MRTKDANYVIAIILLCISLHGVAADGYTYRQGYISIIIDDIGYRIKDDKRAIALPGPVTYAIMPFSPHAKKISQDLQRRNKDILLHMPMQALQQKHNRFLGPAALTLDMDKPRFIRTVDRAIASLPIAVGMNNHMGSLLSQQPQQMQWLMEVLKRHGLFYVDSFTIRRSQAKTAARQYQVPYLRRDVFLDHKPTADDIRARFQELINTARRKGTAVAIGHPRPATLSVLEKELQRLNYYSVKLVKLGELLQQRKRLRLADSRL